ELVIIAAVPAAARPARIRRSVGGPPRLSRVCASSSAGSATPSAGRPWSAGVVSVVMHRPWPTPRRDGAGRPEVGTDRSWGGTVDVGLPPSWAWEDRRAREKGRPDDLRRHPLRRRAAARPRSAVGRTDRGDHPGLARQGEARAGTDPTR